MTTRFTLAVAWDWEYDRDFISLLEHQVYAHGRTFYSISHHNLDETLRGLRSSELRFAAFLDRASDTDEKFRPLAHAMRLHRSRVINPPEQIHRAADKATMHLEFLSHGIEVPYTIIISPYNRKREVELTLSDLAHLGRPFIIKPANTTGGGSGVVLGAETLKDVIETRQHHKNDKYLLQERIVPAHLSGRPAWFRIFRSFDEILPCWWDPDSHAYATLLPEESDLHALNDLPSIVEMIAGVCGLDFFSTEIAVTEEGRRVVVDYVNEICDMRLQSAHPDGVPDGVASKVCEQIANNLPIEA